MPDTLYTDVSPNLTNAKDRPEGRLASGAVRRTLSTRTVTLLGSTPDTATDIINIVTLPTGAELLTDLCKVKSNGIATTCTIDIGDAGDANRYTTGGALNVAAAGIDDFGDTTGAPYVIEEGNNLLFATYATLVTPVEGKILQFFIYWVHGST